MNARMRRHREPAALLIVDKLRQLGKALRLRLEAALLPREQQFLVAREVVELRLVGAAVGGVEAPEVRRPVEWMAAGVALAHGRAEGLPHRAAAFAFLAKINQRVWPTRQEPALVHER